MRSEQYLGDRCNGDVSGAQIDLYQAHAVTDIAVLDERAEALDAIQDGVDFALSTPGVHGFCTPGDLSLVPLVLDAAENLTEMSNEEVAMTVADMSGEEIIFPLSEKARH